MDVVWPKPGRYVLAESGGVDSMSLLDILHQRPEYELVVAHFDHGIRPDSDEDRKLVERTAARYGLKFVYGEGKLGPKVSEAVARDARYKFLRGVRDKEKAQAIITAHHQDDLIETAILNMLRGTGRKGMSSLGSSKEVVRPFLNVTKQELIGYAKAHKLKWREDPSNQDQRYLRNYVRANIVPAMTAEQRAEFLNLIKDTAELNANIDTLLVKHLDRQIKREWFNSLPHEVARETLAVWLRSQNVREFDSPMLERLTVAAKTAGLNKRFPVTKGSYLIVSKDNLALKGPER